MVGVDTDYWNALRIDFNDFKTFLGNIHIKTALH